MAIKLAYKGASIRAFIAIELPEVVKRRLADIQESLGKTHGRAGLGQSGEYAPDA